MFSSRFMLFPIFKKKISVQNSHFTFSTLNKKNIEKSPFTYWLNGRWFLQIVDKDLV